MAYTHSEETKIKMRESRAKRIAPNIPIQRNSKSERNAYMRLWNSKNREHVRKTKNAFYESESYFCSLRYSLNKFGITLDQFHSKFENQDFCCAICGEVMDRPHIDHNHTTGKVRGLLCRLCNLGIGALGDTPERCLSAAKYIKSFG